MSYEFRTPNVSGRTTEEQVQQIISYLRQLVQELNYVVGNLTREREEDTEGGTENG